MAPFHGETGQRPGRQRGGPVGEQGQAGRVEVHRALVARRVADSAAWSMCTLSSRQRHFMGPAFELAGRGQSAAMLALIAAILFVIGFIINAANISTSAVFSPFSFLLAGLACLAYHLTGTGPAWSGLRRRR